MSASITSIERATRRNPAWDQADPRSVRLAIREGRHTGHTAGLAPGFVQGNLCILPKDWADEFLLFCQRNPKPCPLLAVSDPGDPHLPALADDLDLRTDVPGYRVFRDGVATGERADIRDLWRDDLVGFVLGCSFSFEEALGEAGVRIKHIERGACVAMYRTNIDCAPAGRLSGKLVVSMRPLKPADAIHAVEITARYPRVHGTPVHIGKPELIGVDLAHPYLGIGVTDVAADELPVFWACGVTPQSVVAEAKPPFCITHVPGKMLVTDRRNAAFALS
ncbi:MAG: putative hydro-lyase [Acetobacteraceae bacterium]